MFESAAGGEAMSDTGYRYAKRRERFRKVVRGRFAFHVRTQGEDDFRGRLDLYSGKQFVDSELFGTDVVQRSDAAAEDVVAASEGARSLDRKDVGGLLDDTDLPADPVFIAANLAEFLRGKEAAGLARAEIFGGMTERGGQIERLGVLR